VSRIASVTVAFLGALVLTLACAGKQPPAARPGASESNARVPDAVPERTAATRAASTGGESERMEERFANEASRKQRQDREAAKKAAEQAKQKRVDVVDPKNK
jgi:hypothetical protein